MLGGWIGGGQRCPQKIVGHTWNRGKAAFQIIVEVKVQRLLEGAYVLSSGAGISQSSGRLWGAGTGKLLLTTHQQVACQQ